MTLNVDPEALAARAAEELPADFVWGAATSAYQIEGAVAADRRRTPKSSARWYANLIAAHRARGAA